MKSTAKILLALCIALLPSGVSARTYRLVQCHIVEYGTGKEYDLPLSVTAGSEYTIEYDIRARAYNPKAIMQAIVMVTSKLSSRNMVDM
jgi:hypothetical protein